MGLNPTIRILLKYINNGFFFLEYLRLLCLWCFITMDYYGFRFTN